MNALRETHGELLVCDLCDGSPHGPGCPLHRHYVHPLYLWFRADAPSDVGTAFYWVEETFALAASDAGEEPEAALREGITEFHKAVHERWIQPFNPNRRPKEPENREHSKAPGETLIE